MPLEKGSSRQVIGHNISEMEASGHPHNQAVAAALNEADVPKARDEVEEYKGNPPQEEPGGYFPATKLTLAQLQKKNEDFWGVGQRSGSAQESPAHQAEKAANIKRVP